MPISSKQGPGLMSRPNSAKPQAKPAVKPKTKVKSKAFSKAPKMR